MTSPDRAAPADSFGTGGFGGLSDGRSVAFSNDPNAVQNYTHSTFQAMTSGAMNGLAARSSTSLNNYVGAATDEMLAGLCRALAGIDILGIEPFGFLNDWANNLDAQARQAVTTASTAQTTASTAKATANSAIATVQTQQHQASTGGSAVSVASFPPNLVDSLGPGWQLGGDAATANWATDPGGDAILAVQSAGAVAGRRYALSSTLMATDDHQATAVVSGNNLNTFGYNGVLVRAAADMSSFVYFVVWRDSVSLGKGTWNAATGTWALTEWASHSVSANSGDTVTLSASGSTYVGSINGVSLVSHSDPGQATPVGPANRSVGLLAKQAIDGSDNVWTGWAAGSFNAADTSPPDLVGTGWSLCRQSTSGVPQAVTGTLASRLSANTLDKVWLKNNVTVVDPGTGVIQVDKSGWYVISVGLQWDAAAGGNPYWVGVFTAPNTSGPWTLKRLGGENVGSAIYAVSGSFALFLTAGSLVAPGYFTGNSAGIRGDAGGTATFFDGTLCSYS